MFMACNNGVKITKKKIVVLSSAASGIAVTTYVTFTLTHNPGIVATIPALLSLAACPAMCVGMGGAFWLVAFRGRLGIRIKYTSQKRRKMKNPHVVVVMTSNKR